MSLRAPVQLFENTAASGPPVFAYRPAGFLQADMIDVSEGAAPALGDLDGDGRPDLFMADATGQLRFFGDYRAQTGLFAARTDVLYNPLGDTGAKPPGWAPAPTRTSAWPPPTSTGPPSCSSDWKPAACSATVPATAWPPPPVRLRPAPWRCACFPTPPPPRPPSKRPLPPASPCST